MWLGSFPVVSLVVFVLPIYGQKTTSEEQHDQKATETQQKESPRPASVADINKPAANTEEQRHTNQADSYFDALFSPNNIPNVALALVGIGGIIVALRTLNWLKTQTRAVERQANLMERQANLMERQVTLTEPRLHVDCVRAAAFTNGQSPVFFVRVINSGIIAAENVAISMEAETEDGITVRNLNDQVITVPAGGWRECFIRSNMVLDGNQLAAYDSRAKPLRVSGHIKWSDKAIEYCYKYNPWPFGARPSDLPLFVPCDFETRVNVAIEIEAATLAMSGALGAVKIEASPSPTDPGVGPDGPT